MREMDLISPGKEGETREVFSQALGNAINHGNKNNPNKHIFVNASATNKHILTSIQDEGDGFFPDDHIDETDLNAKIWNRSKGLRQIYKLAKKVVFNAKGNQIIFILERAK
jgi:serine/threonine-protein kinase RsbW